MVSIFVVDHNLKQKQSFTKGNIVAIFYSRFLVFLVFFKLLELDSYSVRYTHTCMRVSSRTVS